MDLRNLAVFVAALGCCFGSGCKETTSCDNIRTGGIAMLIDVVATSATSSRVQAELLVGGDESNTVCILQSDDELIAEAGDEEKTMEAIDDGLYEAKFGTGEADTEFRVRLVRTVDDDSAENNTGTLPPPFDVTSDFPDPLSRMQDSMEITWDPADSGDDMELEIEDGGNDCFIAVQDFDIPGDSGSYTLEPGDLDAPMSADEETCDAEGRILRKRTGSTDSALDSESRFRLRQVRGFDFVTAP
jgi:hypothetical protein